MQPHGLVRTFVVLDPKLVVTGVAVSPGVYERLDRDFAGFKGHVLIAVHELVEPWPTWEHHPAVDEVVVLLSGLAAMRLVAPDGEPRVSLDRPSAFIAVSRGTWRTADVAEPTRMLFITPGEGTENRDLPAAG